ncbi:MAG TPA: hypothetical protein VK783_10615 [Bacteroidia bacterium]|jgi:hypothetical protein|nr:hypothetical protein [Bacteroidia bacterium]
MKRILPRLIITFLIAIVLVSCENPTYKTAVTSPLDLKGFSLRKVKLINYCGTLSVYLPVKMDTAFQFRDPEDNACDDYMYFRFASRSYSIRIQRNSLPMLKGKNVEPDSLYQATIIQQTYPDCQDNKTLKWDSNSIKKFEYDFMAHSLGNVKSRFSLQKINNRDFIMGLICEKYRANENIHEDFIAYCIVNRQIIRIKFSAYKKDTTGFFAEAEKSIHTIEISPDTVITNSDVTKAMVQKGIDYLIYGSYTEFAPGGFAANMKKINKTCLIKAENGESFQYDEKNGGLVKFTTDTMNEYYFKNDKILIDSIPSSIINAEDEVYVKPDITRHNAIFLQIKVNNRIKTFHFGKDQNRLSTEVKRYVQLLESHVAGR